MKSRYISIQDVVIDFGEKIEPPLAPNSLYLWVKKSGQEWGHRLKALVIHIDEDLERRAITDVVLEFWDNDERMAPIRSVHRDNTSCPLTGDVAFVTQFAREESLHHFLGLLRPIEVDLMLETLRELSWMRGTGFRPEWYDDDKHAFAFHGDEEYNLVDYEHEAIYLAFEGPTYQRARNLDRLVRELESISPVPKDADAFHNWVKVALEGVFFEDLDCVRKNANGNAPERRDLVATNRKCTDFWKRLRDDYGVSNPLFEVKNYPEPTSSDFQQVCSYLGFSHYGSLAFIVTHSESLNLSERTLSQFRMAFHKGKVVIALPSALLVRLLDVIRMEHPRRVSRIMEDWLEEFLLKHIY